MAIVQEVYLDNMPSIGDFMTTDRMRAFSDNIRYETEQRFENMFGNVHYRFNSDREAFINLIDRKNQEVSNLIDNTLHAVFLDNKIFTINTEEKLQKGVPKAMELAILTSPIIRKALEADTIYGFGIDPAILPRKDIVGRMINNGETNNEGIGTVTVKSDDPNFSVEDLFAIEDTREFMEDLLKSGIDPTDYPNRVGGIK